MPTDTGGDAGNASQNQTTDVAKQAQPGAKGPQSRAAVITEREEMLSRIDEQLTAQRIEENERVLESGDPRAILIAAEMGRESRGEPINADRRPVNRPAPESGRVEPITQSAEARQEAEAAAEAAREATQVGSDGNDPLADYIVREEGKPPMFRTVVDGKTVLIPLDRARVQLQKHLAADIRLQQAAERQRNLDARERQIRSTETTLAARAKQPPQGEAIAITDADLDKDAAELVRSLVSEPEAVATQKMAGVLKKIRQAATPQIDAGAIAQRAAEVAVTTIVERDTQKDLKTGLEEFTKAYPEIAADSDLFDLADRKTNAIAQEHPDWAPAQVMMEAGRVVREKFGRSGPKPVPRDPSQPGDARRQQAKGQLTPMPVTRTARPAPAAAAEEDNSAQAAFREVLKARGQPY